MRNILKWYHEITAISVTLSAWTWGTASFVPTTWTSYTLSSLPIWTQIALTQIEWVDTYVFLHNNNEIWTLTTTPGSWYELDDAIVKRGWVETSVTATPITLQDWDIIYVAFRVEERLLARSLLWFEMVWDRVDSIWFRFTNVHWLSNTYSWEIWIADTDYWMPSLNQLGLYPNVIPTAEDIHRMAVTWWDCLYAPWITDVANLYEDDSWYWGIDPSTYDWVPSQNWANTRFVWLNEWTIIMNMFTQINMREAPDWTSFANLMWVQIPWSYIPSSAYSYLSYDTHYWKTTLSSKQVIWYIPGDYNSFWSSSDTSYATVAFSNYPYNCFPQYYGLELEVNSPDRKIIELWKMRVLNTTKTNYSLDS